MKQIVYTLIFCLNANFAFSQFQSEIETTLRYPLPVGDNFINKGGGKGYTGLFDVELGYNAFKFGEFNVGVTVNASWLKLRVTDLSLTILSPKIKLTYTSKLDKIWIIPTFGIGYSYLEFKTGELIVHDELGNLVNLGKFKESQNGISFTMGTKAVFNTGNRLKWYAFFAYEFTKLEKPSSPVVNSSYNRNLQMLYPGVGLMWSFTK